MLNEQSDPIEATSHTDPKSFIHYNKCELLLSSTLNNILSSDTMDNETVDRDSLTRLTLTHDDRLRQRTEHCCAVPGHYVSRLTLTVHD